MEAGAVKFEKGKWVAEKDTRRPLLGIIKDVWSDEHGVSLDIIVHTWNGERVGRVSPPEGGPTTFEPCCHANHYALIEKPQFPLKVDRGGAYAHELKFI